MFTLSVFRATGIEPNWPLIDRQRFIDGLAFPTSLAHAGDGSDRLFVTEQPGTVRIVQSSNLLPEPFLSLTNRVFHQGEAGLLSIAFPPGFGTKQHFYVTYARKPDSALVLSRFSVSQTNSNEGDPASEQILFTVPPPVNGPNHYGGKLAFGPDGFLYIFLGDASDYPFANAQNPQKLQGKILRIDPQSQPGAGYTTPSSNPFITNPAFRPEVWAMGLRNPWGATFDRATGDLYIPDVGAVTAEEINFQPAGSSGGQNYGWHFLEGFTEHVFVTNAMTPPVFTYPGGAGPAIVGGVVYRGTNYPRMQGMYFFGDFGVDGVWALHRNATAWQAKRVFDPGPFGLPNLPSGFGEDESGEIYEIIWNRGELRHLVDTLQCYPPVLEWTNTAFSPLAPVSSATLGATIHYTREERVPAANDPFVVSPGNLPVTTGVTYRLRAFAPDLLPSTTVTSVFSQLKAATPRVIGTLQSNGILLTASSITPGADIYFTTDGSTPAPGTIPYTGPIHVELSTYALFSAFADGYEPSEPATLSEPIFISQQLTNQMYALRLWLPVLQQYDFQSSIDLTHWRTFNVLQSDRTTNAVVQYPSGPMTEPWTRFFRAGIAPPHGPP
jgi:glucose/arabinose dehydrogenase